MRNYLLAAIAAGTIATPALAQPAGPAGGFRLEGLVGYDRAHPPGGGHSDGVTYGVGAGYDFRMGGAVAGIEAELTDSTVDECFDDVIVVGDSLCAGIGRDIYVGGRVGAAVGGNSVIYGKAGYTNLRVSTDYTGGVAGSESHDSESLDGLRFGAGAEIGLGPNSYVKTEYRYSNYEQGLDRHQVVAGFGFRF